LYISILDCRCPFAVEPLQQFLAIGARGPKQLCPNRTCQDVQIVKHLHLACTCSLSLCDRGSYAFFGEQGGAAAEAVPHAAGGAAAQLQGLLQGQQPQQQQAPPPAPPLPADMRIRAAEAAMRRQAAGAAAAGEAGETGLAGDGAAAGPAANSAAVPADLCGQAGSAAAGPSSGECPAQGNEGSEEQRMLEAAMAASRQSFTAEQSPRQVGLMCRCVRGNQGNAICRTCYTCRGRHCNALAVSDIAECHICPEHPAYASLRA